MSSMNKSQKYAEIAEILTSRFNIKWCNKYPKQRFYVYNEENNMYILDKALLEKEIINIWQNARIRDISAILSIIKNKTYIEDIEVLNGANC